MKLAGDALFNLLLNSLASFWVGLAVAVLLLVVFKPRINSVVVLVLCLPFAKVLWDLRWGIPAGSFFWAYEHGAKQRLGWFQVGFGATPLGGPRLVGQLVALYAGGRAPQSIADLLCRALSYRVWKYAAALLGFGTLSVSLFKLGGCAVRQLDFRRRVAPLFRAGSELETRAVGRRRVQIWTSEAYQGVPFAGGIIRPYVVLPKALTGLLSDEQREAVILHELGHIEHYDLPLLWALELLGDLLWYVPGARAVLRHLRRALEERADDTAVKAGVSRSALVNALLTVGEATVATGSPPTLAIVQNGSALRSRIERLLSPPVRTRRAVSVTVLRALVIVWIVLGALQATACGNHPL